MGASDSHEIGSQVGRAWTQVWAKELTPEGIEEAYRSGRIFGSTGPEITKYSVSDRGISIEAKHDKPMEIELIGQGGKVLYKGSGDSANYKFRGDEGYVRAVVTSENGSEWAFGQPHFIGRTAGWSTAP